MTSERREILFIYADGRTLASDCDRAIVPALILEQMEIDSLEDYVRITHFKRTTADLEEPMIYEEFKSELKIILEGNTEAIRRIRALRTNAAPPAPAIPALSSLPPAPSRPSPIQTGG